MKGLDLAMACRRGAIELLKRAQDIVEAGGCGCADIEGDGICAACKMQQDLESEIKYLETRKE